MARTFGSWLSGPPPSDPSADDRRLGLPKDGTGSLAGMGRRILAVTVDWLIAMGLASLLGLVFPTLAQYQAGVLEVIWLVIGAVSVRLFGFTPGQIALGLQVASVDHREHVGLGRALIRVVLVALVVPPLFTDADGRGVQDRLTGTAVVRR